MVTTSCAHAVSFCAFSALTLPWFCDVLGNGTNRSCAFKLRSL